MLYVKKSGLPGAGKGLFTDAFIRKGARVVEYKGNIVTMKEYLNDGNEEQYGYMLYYNKNHCIDAFHCPEALARYANDANGLFRKKGLFNNCKYEFFGKRGWIVAFRNIQPHSEILVGYGKEYWDDVRYNLRLDRLRRTLRRKKREKRAGRVKRGAVKGRTKIRLKRRKASHR
jgi:hypothetical protein